MTAFRLTRCATTLILALGAVLLGSSGASGQASVTSFQDQEPLPPLAALPECLDTTVGTQTGTETTTGQAVFSNADGTFHSHGTTTLDYRVVFADGRYVVGSSVEHFSFNFNAPVSTNTVAIQEIRTIFGADGQVTGTVMIHALSHVTFRDTNGNFAPDPGEITVSVDRFFFTCG